MKNWKKLFPQTILARGRLYFDAKNVRSLSQKNNVYTAFVSGNELYTVSIITEDKSIKRMHCDCPYANSGNACKHMAAVLYAIDEYERKTEKNLKQESAPLLFEPKETRGKFFDIEKLTKAWEISPEKYLKAKLLYQNHDISKLHIKEGFHSFFSDCGYTLSARYGNEENEWQGPNICIERDHILNSSCNCSRETLSYSNYYYGGRTKPCEHLIMLAWCMKDYILKFNPGDITDLNSAEFIKEFRRQKSTIVPSDVETGRSVKLKPRIEYEYGSLSVSFKIGKDKMYIVKKLVELVECVSLRKKFQLGKNSEINFATDKFDSESLAYYNLIQRYVKEEALRSEEGLNISNSRSYSKLHLFGSTLDEFYDMCAHQTPEFTNKSTYSKKTSTTLKFDTAVPKISLNIEKRNDKSTGEFEGICISGEMPELIAGIHHHYFMDYDVLHRIPNEEFNNIRILYAYSYYENFNLTIGRKNMAEFFHHILPTLKEIAEFDESEIAQIEDYIPPAPVFSFYLDAENSVPVCKAQVSYGDMTVLVAQEYTADNDMRNIQYEREVLRNVQSFFPLPGKENGSYMSVDSEDAVFNILEKGINELLSLGEVHSTDRFNALKIKRKMKISIGVSIESELMNLSVSATDISNKELIEILKSYRLKKKYHRLKNGNFISLDESIEKLNMLLDSMRIDDKQLLKENIQIPSYRALYLDKMLEMCDDIESQRDKRFRKFVKDFKTVGESDFEAPNSLSAIMRNYQLYGHKWLRTISESGFGAILADDMGLGKTLQMISVLLAYKEDGGNGTSIVICPASLVYNWQEEFLKFAPSMNICVVSGNSDEREKLIENYSSYNVLITSYDLFKRDIAFYENKAFEYQILDEAQNIKNHSTAASKSVKILKSKKRFALTGTPIENRLSELWSIFDYLMPGYLYSYDSFKKEFETPIVKKQDKNATEKLKYMVSPFILRRLKSDVLKDLPNKIEEVRYAKFNGKQQSVYDGQVAYMQDMLESQSEDDFSKNKIRILAELTRIRQICCDPSLVFEDYNGESAKKEACIDLIQSAIEGNHKILVFSQFTSMFELLEEDFKANGITYYKITGEIVKKRRLELVKKFNSDSTNVFLISLKAGGTGLNLTGADVVIHYDPWWNIAAQNQATDRAHRIGQEKIVSVYKLIAKGTIEENILLMQEKKKELADAVISGEAGQFTSMSRDDIIKLLK